MAVGVNLLVVVVHASRKVIGDQQNPFRSCMFSDAESGHRQHSSVPHPDIPLSELLLGRCPPSMPHGSLETDIASEVRATNDSLWEGWMATAAERKAMALTQRSSSQLMECLDPGAPAPEQNSEGRPATRSQMLALRREEMVAQNVAVGMPKPTLPTGSQPGAPGKNPEMKRADPTVRTHNCCSCCCCCKYELD